MACEVEWLKITETELWSGRERKRSKGGARPKVSKDEIHELRYSGLSAKKIAEKLGVNESYIYSVLRK